MARSKISKELRQKVFDKYQGCCAYCGYEFEDMKEMQVDHLNPVYLNGEDNSIENLMPACRMCNFYKSTYTLEKFREQLGKILNRLSDQFIFRLAHRYNLVEVKPYKIPVQFYFEWLRDELGE